MAGVLLGVLLVLMADVPAAAAASATSRAPVSPTTTSVAPLPCTAAASGLIVPDSMGAKVWPLSLDISNVPERPDKMIAPSASFVALIIEALVLLATGVQALRLGSAERNTLPRNPSTKTLPSFVLVGRLIGVIFDFDASTTTTAN